MGVSLAVAVTDGAWFKRLRRRPDTDEVNFWSPSPTNFRALRAGELLLFKLHAPRNAIVGGGVFAHACTLPCSLAWEAFGEANGAGSIREMRAQIARYRPADPAARGDFRIGCRVLAQPFFFEEPNWLPAPRSWSRNIVSLKKYSTDDSEGLELWRAVQERLQESAVGEEGRLGAPQLARPRLGQGGFRVLVTDAYGRRCAVTRERTLPALDAAHIQPYGDGGRHEARNGLLLRRDVHKLFDDGYVTVTPGHRFEVSRRIREEFENGRHYYAMHGQRIHVPDDVGLQPDPDALRRHNECCYLG